MYIKIFTDQTMKIIQKLPKSLPAAFRVECKKLASTH